MKKSPLHCLNSLLLLFLLIIFIPGSYAQTWKWGRGNTGGEVDGWPVACDNSGNVFAAGIFVASPITLGSITIPYSSTASAWGGVQAFVVKYDSSGNVIWANGVQTGESCPVAIAADPSGNLILLGVFDGTQIQIGNSTLVNTSSNSSICQYFIVKFDPLGNVIWAKTSGTASGFYNISLFSNLFSTSSNNLVITWGGVSTDAAGNIFVAGDYKATTNTIGSFTVTNTNPSGDSDDVFIAKYNPSGNAQWASNMGGSGMDDAFGMTVSSTGDVYISGGFTSPTCIVGSSTLNNPYGSQIAFIAKFSPSGTPLWAEAGGGYNGAIGVGMTNDQAGNVYMAGGFGDSTISFGATLLSRAYPGDSYNALFLIQVSAANTITWHKTISSPTSHINGYSVALASCGEVWVSGSWGRNFSGINDSANIDGHILYTPVQDNRDPIFIAGYNLSGGVVGFGALGGGGDDQNGIACDPWGNVYLCSDYLSDSIRIANDILVATNPGEEYLFVAKFQNIIDTGTIINVIDTSLCSGNAILQAPLSSNSPYLWSSGDTTSSMQVSASGTFWLKCHGTCSSGNFIDTFNVTLIDSGIINKVTDTVICTKNSVSLSAPQGYSSYLWSNGVTSTSITLSSPGTYWVFCTIACGSQADTFHIRFNNANLLFSIDTLACGPVTAHMPLDSASYLWQDGSTGQSHTFSNTGAYPVLVSEQGCSENDTVHVSILNLQQHLNDSLVCMDAPFNITYHAIAPINSSILWSNGSTNAFVNISDTGLYWVYVKDSVCSNTDTIHLTGGFCNCACFVPNAFTPNHDGLNEGVRPLIKTECQVSNYTFSIFDRWGTLVFTSHDPSARWDGTYKGVPYEIGTYMYEASYTGGVENKKYFFKGDVTLIR